IYIQQLPYGRNSNRCNFNLVLKEHKGTCSTKHAVLAEIAKENNIPKIKLILGIYKMCEENTPGVGSVLSKWDLKYIPEAHCYLKIKNNIIDLTRNTISSISFSSSLLSEEEITPIKIGSYKVKKHQAYLKEWIMTEAIPYNFNDIWNIREACIANLKQ